MIKQAITKVMGQDIKKIFFLDKIFFISTLKSI